MTKYKWSPLSERCWRELVQWFGEQSARRKPQDQALYDRVRKVLANPNTDETPEHIWELLADEVSCGDTLLKPIEVANRIGYNRMRVSRLCKDGKLKTNGKDGKALRIVRSSVIDYCEREKITYNETMTGGDKPFS